MSRGDHRERGPSSAPRSRALAGKPPRWVDDTPAEIRAPLDLHGDATGSTAARGRREFTAWLAVDLAAGELFDDLVLVVYEALANVADHAYTRTETGTGPMRLRAHRSQHAIQITVADHGTWRATSPGDAFRGRGITLIRLLIRDVHIQLDPTGTVVHLRTPLPAPPE